MNFNPLESGPGRVLSFTLTSVEKSYFIKVKNCLLFEHQ